jgi:hypothetical protein
MKRREFIALLGGAAALTAGGEGTAVGAMQRGLRVIPARQQITRMSRRS